ncbi:MAG TPA: EF-hand domain-containing protein [Azospirillaceae bacterium]|nr:EF-hand domain-containing protein [Azospirillaceae bacterium]
MTLLHLKVGIARVVAAVLVVLALAGPSLLAGTAAGWLATLVTMPAEAADPAEEDDADRLFDRIDADGDGRLSREEIRRHAAAGDPPGATAQADTAR